MRIWISGLILSLCMNFGWYYYAAVRHTGIQTEAKEENSAAPSRSQLYAKAAALIDGESGRVLYEKNGDVSLPMASTTKIMTCILVLENAGLKEVVTVSSHAASMPDVQLNIREGEKYYVGDLLYSLMLESHNDVAMALAEHVGGSREGFARMMNDKARELGCEGTYFVTPNGLDATARTEDGTERTHSATAVELAQIMQYCIRESPQKDAFLKITRTPSYAFTDTEGKRRFSCNNHNAFLGMMEGALSGKTGFTGNAGYCYVGALEKDGKTFIVALLACGWPNHKSYKWSDTRKLMEYGLEQYEYKSLDEAEKEIDLQKDIPVMDGRPKAYGQQAEVGISMGEKSRGKKFLLRKNEEIEVVCHLPSQLAAPVKKGAVIGRITYRVSGENLWETELTADSGVERLDFDWCLKEAARRYFCFL